jgi:pimeloyl-ACP methyl ester carboxylesterase
MVQKELNYNGKRLLYQTIGEGSIVVLLPGFAEDATIWKNQYSIFPNNKLIIPHLPGSGGSEIIDDMSIEGLAEAVKHILSSEMKKNFPTGTNSEYSSIENNNLHLSEGGVPATPPPEADRGAVIGHSMGGYITLAFAEKYPEMLNAIGLFHSTALADNKEKKETRRKGIEFITKYSAGAFLKTTIPNLYSDRTKSTKPEVLEEQMSTAHNFSSAALVCYYESMIQRKDRTDILRSSKVPVLFVMGRYDAAVPIEDSLRQCHLPQIAYIHILEESGHMGMIEEIEKTNKILSGFITITENSTNT